MIETKYDGERIQCHFNDEKFMFFTRFQSNTKKLNRKLIKNYLKNI